MFMLQQFGSAAVYGNIFLLNSTFYSDKCIFILIEWNRKKSTIPNHKQKHRNQWNQHLFQEITKSQLICMVFVPNTHLTMQNVGYCNWFSLFACNFQIFLSISRNKWSNYVDFSNLHWICQHNTHKLTGRPNEWHLYRKHDAVCVVSNDVTVNFKRKMWNELEWRHHLWTTNNQNEDLNSKT